MSLGSLILSGLQGGAGSVGDAYQIALATNAQRLREEEHKRQLLQEEAGRTFWKAQLSSLLPQPGVGPAPSGGFTYGGGLAPPAGDVPTYGGGAKGAAPVAEPPVWDLPNVSSDDLQSLYSSTRKTQHEKAMLDQRTSAQQAKELRQGEIDARFDRAVESFADIIRNEGHPQEAEKFTLEAKASRKWPDWATKPRGLVEPAVYEKLLSTDPTVQAQGKAEYRAATGKDAGTALLKSRPTFTPEMVKGAYPTLPDDAVQGVVDASNESGRLIRPIGIELHPDKNPTKEEAEARAVEIMKDAGIEDPETHQAFGLVSYKIQHSKDIDQKTADRIFGNSEASTKIVVAARAAMAKDAAARMARADSAVNAWRRGATTSKQPLPPALEAEQRNARRAYEQAMDTWESALGGVQHVGQPAGAAPSGSPLPQTAAPADPRTVMESIRSDLGIPVGAALTPEQREAMKAEYLKRTGGKK